MSLRRLTLSMIVGSTATTSAKHLMALVLRATADSSRTRSIYER